MHIFKLLHKLHGNDEASKQGYSNIKQKLTSLYKFNKMLMQPFHTYSSWVAKLKGRLHVIVILNVQKMNIIAPFVNECIRNIIILHTPHEHVLTDSFTS